FSGGRVRAQRAVLSCLIQGAYNLRPFQIIGGPPWMDTLHYDVDAKSESTTNREQVRLMLQTLLEDRFKLKVHRETRQLAVYALTVARSGLKLQPPRKGSCATASPGPNPLPPPPSAANAPLLPCGQLGVRISRSGVAVDGGKVAIADFIAILNRLLDRPTIDQTGLTGTFDIHLAFAADDALNEGSRTAASPQGGVPAPPVDHSTPTIFTAVQEQLGLRLG